VDVSYIGSALGAADGSVPTEDSLSFRPKTQRVPMLSAQYSHEACQQQISTGT
jgi:hypothetical protein